MSSSSSQEMSRIQGQEGALAQQAYGVGIPALEQQLAMIKQTQGQSDPFGQKGAFAQQRTNLMEGAMTQDRASLQQRLAQQGTASRGGNTSAALTPDMMGAKLAQSLQSSQVNQGMAQLDESNKLMGMQLGQTVQAGSGAMAAGSQQLQAAGMMPQYNPLMAQILGYGSAAGALYGGMNKAGWFGGSPAGAGSGGATGGLTGTFGEGVS